MLQVGTRYSVTRAKRLKGNSAILLAWYLFMATRPGHKYFIAFLTLVASAVASYGFRAES